MRSVSSSPTAVPPGASILTGDHLIVGVQPEPLKRFTSGHLYTLSGSSGSGCTTVMNNLLDSNNGLRVVGIEKQFTRQFRTGESASQQVHQEDMFRDIGRGNFLYFMNAHGNWYYTPLQNIAKALDKGSNALLELPSRVALELKRLLPNLVTTFLIVPPKTAAGRYDEEVLAGRLRDRMEDVGKIQERVVTGRDALVEADRFDYVIENPQAKAGEKLADAATREIEAVIRARETSSKVSFQGRMNAFNPFILLSPAQVA